VARRVGRDGIPDVVWDHPDVKECTGTALERHDPIRGWERAQEEIDDLVRGVLRELGVYGGQQHQHTGRQNPQMWNGRLNPREEARRLALGEYFGRMASLDYGVRLFRLKAKSGPEMLASILEPMWSINSSAFTHDPAEPSDGAEEALRCPLPLSKDEAEMLLRSEAARYMSWDQFADWHVPVIGHRSTAGVPRSMPRLSWSSGHSGNSVAITFEDLEKTVVLRAPAQEAIIDGFQVDLSRHAPKYRSSTDVVDTIEDAWIAYCVKSGDPNDMASLTPAQRERAEVIRDRIADKDALRPTRRPVRMHFENELVCPFWKNDNKPSEEMFREVRISVWPGSVLDNLREVSVRLAQTYHWDEALSTWFVLTGEVPPFWPIRAQLSRVHGRDYSDVNASIEITPWISYKTLSEMYQRLQNDALGADNRPVSLRSVALFRFVQDRCDREGKQPTWAKLMQEWNQSKPAGWDGEGGKQEWEYSEWRSMCRDYGRARLLILRQLAHNVPLGERAGRLVSFVDARRGKTEDLVWHELLDEWNASKPDDWDKENKGRTWGYRSDSAMRDAYRRAKRHQQRSLIGGGSSEPDAESN